MLGSLSLSVFFADFNTLSNCEFPQLPHFEWFDQRENFIDFDFLWQSIGAWIQSNERITAKNPIQMK